MTKKPVNPIIIEGFPGFGLVGTITTEFLIEQLKAELIGVVKIEDVPAMVAIHEGKIVQPVGIFYDKKTNIVILHVVTSVQGIEWDISKALIEIADKTKAKELISIEGVGGPGKVEESKCFYYSNTEPNRKKFQKIAVEPLKEGIIIGVTGALMLEAKNKIPMSCIFAETHTQMPDSIASAKVISVIDKYLNLKIDPKPLLEQAQKFENKLQKIFDQGKQAIEMKEAKEMSYVG